MCMYVRTYVLCMYVVCTYVCVYVCVAHYYHYEAKVLYFFEALSIDMFTLVYFC